MGMDFETSMPTREAFQQLVIANVMGSVIGQLWDKAEKIAEDYLNPFIESNYIEGFDTDFDSNNAFTLVVHFASEEDLTFVAEGAL